jgi:hypothetical protein
LESHSAKARLAISSPKDLRKALSFLISPFERFDSLKPRLARLAMDRLQARIYVKIRGGILEVTQLKKSRSSRIVYEIAKRISHGSVQ